MVEQEQQNELAQLAKLWLVAKRDERAATEERRWLEDKIKSLAGVSENLEGTEVIEPEGYVIKIVGRYERKVDSERAQEIAVEHGLTDQLQRLFRWKAEVNMAAWKAADESITRPFEFAITAKPGRPSFSISKE